MPTATLLRDPHSKALLSTDLIGLQQSRAKRRTAMLQQEHIHSIFRRLTELESKVEDIETQLTFTKGSR